jgi:hypothetical protein
VEKRSKFKRVKSNKKRKTKLVVVYSTQKPQENHSKDIIDR